MNVEEIFAILEIDATRDQEAIRAAYRRILASVNPEDDPEGFKRLRAAYEAALEYAQTPDGEEVSSARWLEESGPEAEFLKRLADIYETLPRRLDEAEWDSLMREPVLLSLDSGEQAKWGMFSYLAEHFRLPGRIWKILGKVFSIEADEEEFKEHLPEGFVDYMVRRIRESDAGEFPMEKLSGEPQADYDGFLRIFFDLTNREPDNTPEQLQERGEILGELEKFSIGHPWYSLEQVEYLCSTGEREAAAGLARSLVRENQEDERVYMSGASILMRCGCRDEAGQLYVDYLKREQQTIPGTYTALLNMARLEAERDSWEKARELAQMAEDLRSTDAVRELMSRADGELIERYSGEDRLTSEQALLLARCFVHGERTEEGRRFFESHPEYRQDTADFHEQMALMDRGENLYREAMEEVAGWRRCLEQEGRQESASLARSFYMEGRLWRDIYYQERRAGGWSDEKAGELSGRALAAYDRAVELEPEDTDYRIHRVMVLRDRLEYEAAAEQCRKVIEMDPGAYWAYYYLQELCEELGRDQEVVDLFYRMKGLYDGHQEIYLRAFRVFKRCGQYDDALGIIRQAEQAGVESDQLLVEKIGVLDQLAENGEDWSRTDRYAAQVIRLLEEKKAPRELLAQAYLKRSFLNDSGNKHNKRKKLGLDCRYAEISLRLNDTLSARYALGRYWIEHGGRPRQAYLHLKICEKRGMDYDRLYFYIARCHERFRQWNKAVDYYQKALENNPEYSSCYWRLGLLYKQKYRRTSQPEYAQKALYYTNLYDEKFGASAESCRRRADIYLRMKEFDKALKEVEQGAELDGDSDMLLLQGRILRAMGRYEEAIESCEKSLTAQDRFGADDEDCYKRIFQCFLRMGQLDRGAAYLEKALEGKLEKDAREKCLESLMQLEASAGHFDRALEWIARRYGSSDLERRCCDDWEREADRIDEILDIWLRFQADPGPGIWEKCRQAAKLAQEAFDDQTGEPEGRALACQNVGEAYCRLGDFAAALDFLNRAWELAGRVEKYGYYRSLVRQIMETHHWLGNAGEACRFGDLYRKRLESDYDECSDLGLPVEELMTRDSTESRQILYNLFCWAYYTGRGDRAREYVRLMEQGRGMCWWCDEDGCTELWEAKGLLAMMDGQRETALAAFEQANRVIWMGINKDACTAREMLMKESSEA